MYELFAVQRDEALTGNLRLRWAETYRSFIVLLFDGAMNWVTYLIGIRLYIALVQHSDINV